jgi:hypothetical protein
MKNCHQNLKQTSKCSKIRFCSNLVISKCIFISDDDSNLFKRLTGIGKNKKPTNQHDGLTTDAAAHQVHICSMSIQNRPKMLACEQLELMIKIKYKISISY